MDMFILMSDASIVADMRQNRKQIVNSQFWWYNEHVGWIYRFTRGWCFLYRVEDKDRLSWVAAYCAV